MHGAGQIVGDVDQPCTIDITWETLIYCIQAGGFRGLRGGKHTKELKLKVSAAI